MGRRAHLSTRTCVSLLDAHGRWLGVLARYDPEALALTAADRTTPERVRLFRRYSARRTADARSRARSGILSLQKKFSMRCEVAAKCYPAASGVGEAVAELGHVVSCVVFFGVSA
jgi:hypothetical protein